MMTTKRVISWVKWHNPYRLLQGKKKNNDEEDDGYDNGVANVDVLDDEENEKDVEDSNFVFFTPLGPVPINEHNDPEKIFNFWVGHTNFNVSKKIKDLIIATEGVEIVNIYTRYRFRIGVGRMFSAKNVTRDINRKISEYFREKESAAGDNSDNSGVQCQS